MSDFTMQARAAHPTNTAMGRDYRAWAKQIMYRESKGDSCLLPIQVKFAKEALGEPDAPQQGL